MCPDLPSFWGGDIEKSSFSLSVSILFRGGGRLHQKPSLLSICLDLLSFRGRFTSNTMLFNYLPCLDFILGVVYIEKSSLSTIYLIWYHLGGGVHEEPCISIICLWYIVYHLLWVVCPGNHAYPLLVLIYHLSSIMGCMPRKSCFSISCPVLLFSLMGVVHQNWWLSFIWPDMFCYNPCALTIWQVLRLDHQLFAFGANFRSVPSNIGWVRF